MAEETLVCEETNESWISDDDDERKDSNFPMNRSIPMMGFAFPSPTQDDDERIGEMVEKESDFKPGNDYLTRLRSNGFELRLRNQAIDWIWKACVHLGFGPLCIYLSMNYFDRFLTYSELPKEKAWAVQLLAVSCLSIAAKMEEAYVPQSVDLQVEDPKFVFEAKTIKRMELLVLNALNWRMQVITPFSFIDYFVSKIKDCSQDYIYRSSQLILHSSKEVELLDFKASEIAAAAAIAISFSETVHEEKVLSSLLYVKQERVARCLKMMRGMSGGATTSAVELTRKRLVGRMPESPNGVLEASLSYKSDEITTINGSCTNSSHISPHNNSNNSIKRRKHN